MWRALQTHFQSDLVGNKGDEAVAGTISGLQQTVDWAKSWSVSVRANEAGKEASLERPIRVALRRA